MKRGRDVHVTFSNNDSPCQVDFRVVPGGARLKNEFIAAKPVPLLQRNSHNWRFIQNH